jgi:hypothetical protein
LQAPARVKVGDKLETVECTMHSHKGQTFTIIQEELDAATSPANQSKTYRCVVINTRNKINIYLL